jgi:hypothetical protein
MINIVQTGHKESFTSNHPRNAQAIRHTSITVMSTPSCLDSTCMTMSFIKTDRLAPHHISCSAILTAINSAIWKTDDKSRNPLGCRKIRSKQPEISVKS